MKSSSPTRSRLVSFLCLAGLSMAATSAFAAVPPCDYPFICVGTTPAGSVGSFSTEGATAGNFQSTAVGQGANAGYEGSAFGYNANASGDYASAFGANVLASGASASVFGNGASGSGNWTSAFGTLANAYEDGASAFGMGSQAGYMGSAFGYNAVATTGASFAAGANAFADAYGAIAIGNSAHANMSIAIGQEAQAASPSNATTQSVAIGYKASSITQNGNAIAIGSNATNNFNSSGGVAIGANTLTQANCVALGMGSTCDTDGTVSVGSPGNERMLVNVAPGRSPTDAANFGQLDSAAAAFGGGAGFTNGVFNPPTYTFISGNTYNNVGSALTDLDGRVNALETAPTGAGVPGPKGDKGDTGATGPQGPQGPAGADGTNGKDGTNGTNGKDGTNGTNGTNGVDGKDGAPGAKGDKGDPGINGKDGTNGTNGKDGTGTGNGTDAKAVHYDSLADGSVNTKAVTLQGTDGTTVSNVSDGRVNPTSMDAVNGRQLYQAQADARTYTDKGVQEAKDWAKSYTDQRMRELNGRFDTTQAMAAAQSSLASQLGALNGRNRIGAAVGFAGGHNGIAVGYQHVNAKGNVAFGVHGSVAGRDRAVGVGVGYSW